MELPLANALVQHLAELPSMLPPRSLRHKFFIQRWPAMSMVVDDTSVSDTRLVLGGARKDDLYSVRICDKAETLLVDVVILIINVT